MHRDHISFPLSICTKAKNHTHNCKDSMERNENRSLSFPNVFSSPLVVSILFRREPGRAITPQEYFQPNTREEKKENNDQTNINTKNCVFLFGMCAPIVFFVHCTLATICNCCFRLRDLNGCRICILHSIKCKKQATSQHRSHKYRIESKRHTD